MTSGDSSTQIASPLEMLRQRWMSRWQEALSLWSPYVRLRSPIFCLDEAEEADEQLSGSFAMIRLTDFTVVLSLFRIHKLKLDDFSLEIMAHEIGHHVYCPADLYDQGRILSRMRRALPRGEAQASFIANLYSDLLINDRLFREHDLRMDKVYLATDREGSGELWNVYMRTYEILWALPKATLTTMEITDEMEGDAVLGNRIIRNFSRDWVHGAGHFAALCYPYLLKASAEQKTNEIWLDAQSPGSGDSIPSGLTETDDDEEEGAAHPSELDEYGHKKTRAHSKIEGERRAGGSYRDPFEYGQILRAMGIDIDDCDIAIRYYRERAVPYLVPFPSREKAHSKEPQPEGLDAWDIGSPIERIDWFESVLKSPMVIPGYTTVERMYGTVPGDLPAREPVDLDIYVDSSGSMPNPTVNLSYLTLAAAIISLSALRAGANVQATLWSGAGEFITTKGFVSDEREILGVISGYLGDGTAFPIHMLRDTYQARNEAARKVHILVISDDAVTTMFDKDEKGNSGVEIARMALKKGGGGGTFVLNLYGDWKNVRGLPLAEKMGWDIHAVTDWESLVEFSRQFAERKYGGEVKK